MEPGDDVRSRASANWSTLKIILTEDPQHSTLSDLGEIQAITRFCPLAYMFLSLPLRMTTIFFVIYQLIRPH